MSLRYFRVASLGLVAAALSSPASATNSWNGYHWARTTTTFNLTVVNSTTSDWDPYVAQAVIDWSQSTVLNMVEQANGDTSSKTRRQCNPPNGQVRICNLAYGKNGWLGLAGISIDTKGHIIRGYTKLNDSYFGLPYYNNYAWRQSVTCQELGHDVGLDHQDTNFNNDPLYSCMDYQDPPWSTPNQHDYDELGIIYAHIDSYNAYQTGSAGGTTSTDPCTAPPGKGCNKSGVEGNNGDIGWGISLGRRGQFERFIRIDPDGTRHITFVTWSVGN